MGRRALATGLAVLVVLAASALAAAQVAFVDVPAGHWAYDALAKLAAAGLVEGYPDGTFGGSRTLTRYEAAMIFSRMLSRLENVLSEDVRSTVASQVQGLSEQVAGDVSQRVTARAMAEIQQSIVAARESLARDLERMVGERLAAIEPPEKVVERVVVEKQPQVTERVVVEQPVERPFQMTDEARAAISALVADLVREELSPERLREAVAAEVQQALEGKTLSEDQVKAIVDAAVGEKLAPILGFQDEVRHQLNLRQVAIEAVQGDQQAIWQKLDELENSHGAELAAVRGDVDAVRAVVNQRVEELAQSVDALRQEFRGELDQLTQRVDGIEKRVEALETGDVVQQSWGEGLRSEILGTRSELQDKLGSLEQQATENNTRLGQDLTNHGERIQALESRVQYLESQLNTTQQDLQTTRDDLGKVQGQVRGMESRQLWVWVGIALAAVAGVLIRVP